jgi:hypothetical protein
MVTILLQTRARRNWRHPSLPLLIRMQPAIYLNSIVARLTLPLCRRVLPWTRGCVTIVILDSPERKCREQRSRKRPMKCDVCGKDSDNGISQRWMAANILDMRKTSMAAFLLWLKQSGKPRRRTVNEESYSPSRVLDRFRRQRTIAAGRSISWTIDDGEWDRARKRFQ